MKIKIQLLLIATISFLNSFTQPLSESKPLTHADSLRGTYGPTRDWWDVLKYDLHVKFNLKDSSISGYNVLQFKVLKKGNLMQIDLQDPMVLDSIVYSSQSGKQIKINLVKNDGNAYFFSFGNNELQNTNYITLFYHGKPTIAIRPPWDGGLIWAKDKNRNPFVSVACQGLGASVWYPCKDHQADEPDSAQMHITIPDSLVCVGNGKFRGKINNNDGTATYDWAVVNPINNYTLIPYIGKYEHFDEIFPGEMGNLSMDYWVLDYNLAKAKEHFKDAARMMKAFEYWFGPYPFYEDGYKLVEAPHLGMEHQSATAYGNRYKMGYMGQDLSGSGWGLKWDYIIIHESGHEWFANNITTKDIADMWVHEGFTNYSEVLFTEYYYGKKAGEEYVTGIRKGIANKAPVIGRYNVNREGSGDMYAKGANMIHNIRQVINNDELFRQILRGLNATFYHQTVTTKQVEEYISKTAGFDFSAIFNQYLRTVQIPVLEYKTENTNVSYRYSNCIKGFNMPLLVSFTSADKNPQLIKPTGEWQTLHLADMYDGKTFTVDSNFYINTKKVE